MRKMVPLMAAVLAASGCSAGDDRAAAEAGVAQFRQMMEAGRYHDIYVNAADEFRRSASEEDGTRFLRTIHDRLGAVRSASSTGWRVNLTSGGSTVNLTYDTQFALAAGNEDFVFLIGGANARLAGYHVRSPALIGAGALAPAEQAKPSEGAAPAAPVTVAPVEAPKPPEPAAPEPAGGK
jgi:hypothetical protein